MQRAEWEGPLPPSPSPASCSSGPSPHRLPRLWLCCPGPHPLGGLASPMEGCKAGTVALSAAPAAQALLEMVLAVTLMLPFAGAELAREGQGLAPAPGSSQLPAAGCRLCCAGPRAGRTVEGGGREEPAFSLSLCGALQLSPSGSPLCGSGACGWPWSLDRGTPFPPTMDPTRERRQLPLSCIFGGPHGPCGFVPFPDLIPLAWNS